MLYNSDREALAEFVEKGAEIPTGKYYLVVWIFIQNKFGEFLMQKRSAVNKDGKWGTTAGHQKDYETSIEAIISEVKEELGIDISKDKFFLIKTENDEKRFHDVYYLQKEIDIKDIKMQKEEVDNVKWMNIIEINKNIQNNKFHPKHASMFKNCLKYFEHTKENY